MANFLIRRCHPTLPFDQIASMRHDGDSVAYRRGLARDNRRSARWIFAASVGLVILCIAPISKATAICDASPFGCQQGAPCTVSGTWAVSEGCVVDFGEATVTLKGTLKVYQPGL